MHLGPEGLINVFRIQIAANLCLRLSTNAKHLLYYPLMNSGHGCNLTLTFLVILIVLRRPNTAEFLRCGLLHVQRNVQGCVLIYLRCSAVLVAGHW